MNKLLLLLLISSSTINAETYSLNGSELSTLLTKSVIDSFVKATEYIYREPLRRHLFDNLIEKHFFLNPEAYDSVPFLINNNPLTPFKKAQPSALFIFFPDFLDLVSLHKEVHHQAYLQFTLHIANLNKSAEIILKYIADWLDIAQQLYVITYIVRYPISDTKRDHAFNKRDIDFLYDKDQDGVLISMMWVVDEFHDDGGRITTGLQAVDLRDVGVVQRSERLGFTLEPRQPIQIGNSRQTK